MNGRNLFTTAELVTIRELLKRLRNVSKTPQKGIRDSLRKIGFYINDYSYSITLGMLKSILGIVLLFTANALSKKIRGESIV